METDKVVLITGAATGMGRAVALHYAKVNAKVSLADIDAKNLERTAENCSKLNGDKVLKTIIDLTKDEEVKSLVDSTINKFGHIDVLVSCAGILGPMNLLNAKFMEMYDKIMAVNLRSMVLITILCALYLIKRKGCVINIASLAAVTTNKNALPYSISKAGVDHFTRCAALELASYGVRVNAILPGFVTTNLYANAGMTPEESEALKTNMEATTPLKRATGTDEIADLVAFLASDKARSITGGSYVIDAGSNLTGFIY